MSVWESPKIQFWRVMHRCHSGRELRDFSEGDERGTGEMVGAKVTI